MGGIVVALIVAALVVCGVASLFVRRHGESDRPRSDWRSTDEVCKDPSTSRTMRVWLDTAGERHYVAER
jgi:hypothetical protein